MKALDQCEEQEVDVRSPRGLVKVKGWRWQDFAAVRNNVHWLIAHLPSGLMVGGNETNTIWTFPTAHTAAEAMLEISRMRNRWVEIPESELEKDATAIDVICAKHSGVIRGGMDKPHDVARRKSLNGYTEPVVEKEESE